VSSPEEQRITPRDAAAIAAGDAALPGAPAYLPNPRRIIWPAAITAVLLLGKLFPLPELRDALNGLVFDGGHLSYSNAYIAFSPLYDLLDAMALLTLQQHYGLIGSVLLAWLVRRWRKASRTGLPVQWSRELSSLAFVLTSLVGLYAFGIFVPRPMAKLHVNDTDIAVVDLHSHTDASHDGRRGFDVEANRAWHAAAGFDVSYVSDHLSPEGTPSWREVERGLKANPVHAGDATVIATAIEAHSGSEHVIILGATADDIGMFGAPDHLRYGARLRTGVVPVVIQTIPGTLANFARGDIDTLTPSIAIEVNDAAPRGLAQNLRDRPLITRMVDSLNLAPVAASDNHGWGRTAASWTLVRVPGWRSLASDTLAARIEEIIRTRRRLSVRAIERRTPQVGPRVSELVLTVPLMLWEMNATLGPQQRLGWLVWTWAIAHFGPLLRSHYIRRRNKRLAVAAALAAPPIG
jgi:hypothetical protein